MYRKMYYFTPGQTVAFGVVLFVSNAIFLAGLLLDWFLIFLTIPSIVLSLSAIKDGYFTPILVSENEIVVRGKIYNWKDLRITAWPEGTRSFQYQYVLYFGNEYFSSKKQMKKTSICKVYLNRRNLELILQGYKHEIRVVDPFGKRQQKILTNREIAEKIKVHNTSVDDTF